MTDPTGTGSAETEGPAAGPDAGAERPLLRVVSGEATPEEIAAVVAAVAAGATAPAQDHEHVPAPGTASIWSSPGYAHRDVPATFAPGPDSWRTWFWPR